jgi:hypothetical protein
MSRWTIYTAIVGDIDSLMQPHVVDSRFDYVCFVRKGSGRQGVWEIREIGEAIEDDRMLARYAKLHPCELLPDAEWSIWMDGNLVPKTASFYDLIEECISEGTPLRTFVHPYRDCSYDEAYACVAAGKERLRPAMKVVRFLEKEGFPRHCGLCETGILLRSHKNLKVRMLNVLWWQMLKDLSKRDQLSFMYCARKVELDWKPLMPAGTNVRFCECLEYAYHDRQPARPWLVKKWHDGWRMVSKWLLRRKIDSI